MILAGSNQLTIRRSHQAYRAETRPARSFDRTSNYNFVSLFSTSFVVPFRLRRTHVDRRVALSTHNYTIRRISLRTLSKGNDTEHSMKARF